MAEKKIEVTKKNEKELKEVQKNPVKKATTKSTTNKATNKTTKTISKNATTSKTKSSSSTKKKPAKTVAKTTTTKKIPSKTTKTSTPKKESTTTQTKKSVSSKSNAKTDTTKKTTTPKKKGTTVKAKETSKVKIKENSTKTKTIEAKKKKEPVKKITSAKKVEGNPVSSTKKAKAVKTLKETAKRIGKNVKSTSISLLKKLNVSRKKASSSLKNAESKIVSKTKEFSEKSIQNLKNGVHNVKEFLKTKKGVSQKDLVQKPEKVKIIKNLGNTEEKEKIILFPSRKKTKRIFIGVAIFCLVLAVLLMIPYGISTYKSGASNKMLDVPKFMKPKEECCNYSITFSSPRSAWALKKDVEKIINGYERLNCDGKNYYYNAKENYTVTEYGVRRGIFLNQVYFTYGTGNSCDIDTKFKKLELLDDNFSIEDAKKDGNFVMEDDKVYNKNAYDDFMSNVNAKIPSTLRIVTTNNEGDVLITDVEYLNSGKYMVSYDATRDRNNQNPHSIVAYKFEHLKMNKNKLYAYNGDKLVIKKAKKYETFYLLTLPNE